MFEVNITMWIVSISNCWWVTVLQCLASGQETRRGSPMADATSAQLKASLMYSFLDGAEKIRHKNLD